VHDEPTTDQRRSGEGERPASEPSTAPLEPPIPRQRWRLVLARAADGPATAQRELAEAWERAVRDAALPMAWSDGSNPRPRISFGAPLPVGMAADGELIDIVLTERWPVWRVREGLAPVLPAGWRLVDLQDVWLAGPPLAGRVAAADYRIVLAGAPDAGRLRAAVTELLAAPRIPRERAKGGGVVAYDLRPLVIDVGMGETSPPVVVTTRTRFHPELGTGRPEEVIGALAAAAGVPLEIEAIVRERLLLADEVGSV
jgi:radical SAM-linked protein